MSARCKVYICRHSPVQIVGSNPAVVIVVRCVIVSGQVEVLRRAGHSRKGALQPVVRRCTLSRNLKNEATGRC